VTPGSVGRHHIVQVICAGCQAPGRSSPGGTTSFEDASRPGGGKAERNVAGAGFGSAAACHVVVPVKEDVMGREARIALLLAASACLLAVMVDWVVEELVFEHEKASS
jgi:hypothetical protein